MIRSGGTVMGREPGARTTIWDVAREAGVSVSTVSYALNKKGELTKQSHKKVWEVAQRLGYVPDATARSLVTGRTNSIGIAIPPIHVSLVTNPFNLKVMSALAGCLEKRDYWMNIVMPQDMNETAVRRLMQDAKIDGLVWFDPDIPEYVQQIMDIRKIPYIAFGAGRESNARASVLISGHDGIEQAMDYLIENGHRRILFVSGYDYPRQRSLRVEAYLGKMQAVGEKPIVLCGAFQQQRAYQAFSQYLKATPRKDWPTAVLAANDFMAFGVIDALHENSIRIPEEMSVMGYDGIDAAALMRPPLSTVCQPVEQAVDTICEYLFECIETGQAKEAQYRLPTTICQRASVGAPRKE